LCSTVIVLMLASFLFAKENPKRKCMLFLMQADFQRVNLRTQLARHRLF
jgi:hypothetical protein